MTRKTYYNQGEKNFDPTRPSGGSKTLSSAFCKYEIHKGWLLYRIHNNGGYTSVFQWVKKIQRKKSINQSACMNAEMERGRGKGVFSPNRGLEELESKAGQR